MFIERAKLFQSVIAIEGNRGPTLLENECLRVFGDAFQQLDVSPDARTSEGSRFIRP